MKDPNSNCGNCMYWGENVWSVQNRQEAFRDLPYVSSYCKRHAPIAFVPISTNQYAEGCARFPSMQSSDWCGEWEWRGRKPIEKGEES